MQPCLYCCVWSDGQRRRTALREESLNPNHDTYMGRTTSRTHDVGEPPHKRTHTSTTKSAITGRKSVGRPTAADFFDFKGTESGRISLGGNTLSNVEQGRQPPTLSEIGRTTPFDVRGRQPLTLTDSEVGRRPQSLSESGRITLGGNILSNVEQGRQPPTLSEDGRIAVFDVRGKQPLTLSEHAKTRAALKPDPAMEADTVQTVVRPNMTQEGCAAARLSNHPNEMGSAKSQLGHKHIEHKHKDDSHGTRPPKPDPLQGTDNRTKPANTQHKNIQQRGRTQPQPVHLNQTQPRNNSVTAKFILSPGRDDVDTSVASTAAEGKQATGAYDPGPART